MIGEFIPCNIFTASWSWGFDFSLPPNLYLQSNTYPGSFVDLKEVNGANLFDRKWRGIKWRQDLTLNVLPLLFGLKSSIFDTFSFQVFRTIMQSPGRRWVDIFVVFVEPWTLLVLPIDYRFEDGRSPVSASCLTISNPNLLSSSETGVNPGLRSWKKHLSDWARCQKAVGGIYLTKKRRAETLQPGSEFDNFKPRLKSVSSNVSHGWTVRFPGVMIGVFWKRESRPI